MFLRGLLTIDGALQRSATIDQSILPEKEAEKIDLNGVGRSECLRPFLLLRFGEKGEKDMLKQERQAVSIYLNDLYHYRDVKRKFFQVRENYDKNDLLCMVRKLWQRRALDDKERQYLCQRITGYLV